MLFLNYVTNHYHLLVETPDAPVKWSFYAIDE
jgi:hypothetical protein